MIDGITDRTLPLAKLVPNPRNPRRHPNEQIERLVASLKLDGQTRPLLARKANMMLIGGHGVREAMLRLGLTTASVRLLDVDQPTADRIMLADNRYSDLSSHDDARVAELLRELAQTDWMATGYSADEANKILADFDEAEIAVREIETSAVDDVFWISVKGPLKQQAAVLTKLKQLLDEYSDVDVRLGNIEIDETL